MAKIFFNNRTKDEKKISFVFLFVGLVGIDQIVKYFIKTPFLNNNFAFSLPLPKLVIYLVYFFVMSGMLYYNIKNFFTFGNFQKIAWVLIFAGAFSNIAERIIFGSVKDFIYVHLGSLVGIYNIADFYIIFGILGLLFLSKK